MHCKAFYYWLDLCVWELMANWMSSSSQATNQDRLVFIGLMPIKASKNDKCNWIREHLAPIHCQLEIKWWIPDLFFFFWIGMYIKFLPTKQSLQCSRKEYHLKNSFRMKRGDFISSLFAFLSFHFLSSSFPSLNIAILMETDLKGEEKISILTWLLKTKQTKTKQKKNSMKKNGWKRLAFYEQLCQS